MRIRRGLGPIHIFKCIIVPSFHNLASRDRRLKWPVHERRHKHAMIAFIVGNRVFEAIIGPVHDLRLQTGDVNRRIGEPELEIRFVLDCARGNDGQCTCIAQDFIVREILLRPSANRALYGFIAVALHPCSS